MIDIDDNVIHNPNFQDTFCTSLTCGVLVNSLNYINDRKRTEE